MSALLLVVQVLTGLAFLAYGVGCLVSPRIVAEFERFGLARFRPLTGWLEMAGGAGLLVGARWSSLGLAAAAGLMTLMVLGVWARVRVGDPVVAMLPALAFLGINAALVVALLP